MTITATSAHRILSHILPAYRGSRPVELDVHATTYCYAARHLGHGDCELQSHVMGKAKTPKLSVIPAPRTEPDFDRLFTIARDAERLIDAGILLPAAPGWQCATCAYGKACREAYAGKAA